MGRHKGPKGLSPSRVGTSDADQTLPIRFSEAIKLTTEKSPRSFSSFLRIRDAIMGPINKDEKIRCWIKDAK